MHRYKSYQITKLLICQMIRISNDSNHRDLPSTLLVCSITLCIWYELLHTLAHTECSLSAYLDGAFPCRLVTRLASGVKLCVEDDIASSRSLSIGYLNSSLTWFIISESPFESRTSEWALHFRKVCIQTSNLFNISTNFQLAILNLQHYCFCSVLKQKAIKL